MKNEKIYTALRKAMLLILLAAIVLLELGYRFFNDTLNMSEDLYLSVSRVLGGLACIAFMLEFSFQRVFSPLGNKKWLMLLAVLPAFVVAVNNFPFVSFLSGDCSMTFDAAGLFQYALICLCVGFFEEMAFRGCALMYFLKKRTDTRLGVFLAIALSSCVFGIIHLVNIFTSSPGAVIRQIGYSALIGALCSVVLLATRNIWLCVLCHASYNFCGGLIDRLGMGEMWTAMQIAFTAIVAVIVTAYMVWLFFKLPLSNAKDMFKPTSEKNNVDFCKK